MIEKARKADAPDTGSLKRHPVFIAYSFDSRDDWIPRCVPPFLELFGCTARTGADFPGQLIPGSVTNEIALSELLVAFLTRVERRANGGWIPSQWVLQEIGFACGKGIPVVLVEEIGVSRETGILGDIQIIPLDSNREAFAAIADLGVAIRNILYQGQYEKGFAICHLAKRGRIDHRDRQWWDVWVWISGSRQQLQSIVEVQYTFPDSFTPRTERGDPHRAFGDYLETDAPLTLDVKLRFRNGNRKSIKYKIILNESGYKVIPS
jgi:hypothetical protein